MRRGRGACSLRPPRSAATDCGAGDPAALAGSACTGDHDHERSRQGDAPRRQPEGGGARHDRRSTSCAPPSAPASPRRPTSRKLDGQPVDLSRQLDAGREARGRHDEEPGGAGGRAPRRRPRHGAAWSRSSTPGTQVTIGPSIEDGFYYDFARETPFTPEDLEKIEKADQRGHRAGPALRPRGDLDGRGARASSRARARSTRSRS